MKKVVPFCYTKCHFLCYAECHNYECQFSVIIMNVSKLTLVCTECTECHYADYNCAE